MKVSVCQYSFHRTWAAEAWDAYQFAGEAQKAGADAVDFHVRLIGSIANATDTVRAALDKTGLALSGLSLSNNFGHDDSKLVSQEIEETLSWMHIAKEVGAPVSRVFGAPVPSGYAVYGRPDNAAAESRKKLKDRVAAALVVITREAERLELVLALENHHEFPATGEEQVEMIERVNSKFLRATVDVGNYMIADQAPEAGTARAAPYAAYVHVKDFVRVPDASVASGWKVVPCAVGKGEVDHAACLGNLKNAGFAGYVAVEYEGLDDERVGVAQSVQFLKQLCESSQ
jgi:sugar phosphate isomerase/epimerase